MKKNYIGIIALVLALLTAVFCGCGGETPTPVDTTLPETTEEITLPVKSEINIASTENAYRIIRSDDASDAEINLAITLKNSIEKKTGANLELREDFIAEKAGYVESPYEIIIGLCDRQSSRDVYSTLKYRDYEIRICGTQLVICGGSYDALELAVKKFTGTLLTKDGILEGDVLLRYDGEYQVSKITVNGVDISEYTIVFSALRKSIYADSINLINNRIQLLTGQTLTVAASNKYTGTGRTIEFGDCNTALSSGLAPGNLEYTAKVSDGSIAFVCALLTGSKSAVSAALDKYLPTNSTGEVNITLENNTLTEEVQLGYALCEGANLRVMTSNVLGDSTLSSRISLLTEVYLEYCPDFIGLQEANSTAHSGLLGQLGALYNITCDKIGNTDTLSYTPIFYQKYKYKVVDSGCELFNDRWPKTNTKTYSYAVFENLSTGKKVAVINAHWAIILSSYDTASVFGRTYSNSVEGNQWRLNNSKQILEMKDKLRTKYGSDLPVIVMGDMNATASNESVSIFTQSMSNCLNAATVSKTTGVNSFHNQPGSPISGTTPIDHIFVTGDVIKVFTHKIVTTATAIRSSDHCQVVADLSY